MSNAVVEFFQGQVDRLLNMAKDYESRGMHRAARELRIMAGQSQVAFEMFTAPTIREAADGDPGEAGEVNGAVKLCHCGRHYVGAPCPAEVH